MQIPQHISDAITRLVKPEGSKLSTREMLESHADKICGDHNRVLKAMVQFLDTGEISSRQIKDWAAGMDRTNAGDVATMKGVLQGALVTPPAFQGLSDARALEAYSRLLLNLYNLEIIGQPPIA